MKLDWTNIANASEFLQKLSNENMYSHDGIPPVDVEGICKSLGITIYITDLTDVEKKHQGDVAGVLVSTSTFDTILVNDKDPHVRQRFTIAHELAHYVLHHNHGNDGVFISFRGASNAVEREANKFAADLLMPKDILRKRHAEQTLPLLWTLAEEFAVSRAAMRYQLESLGLRYYGS
ncbi:MAG: ImmA/IrrE family metallo-endopeptidase [Defluviitaleaceae bacterium]|nr:ImmA/IrrE family metallo-endopeptidase [Defluviitaleaceae bacterium]